MSRTTSVSGVSPVPTYPSLPGQGLGCIACVAGRLTQSRRVSLTNPLAEQAVDQRERGRHWRNRAHFAGYPPQPHESLNRVRSSILEPGEVPPEALGRDLPVQGSSAYRIRNNK
jgi:hypothetical protein